MLKNRTIGRQITSQEVDVLLERYYDGKTSAAEERQLCHFLSQKSVPARFECDRAILHYFAKKKSKSVITPLIRWTSVAAVFLGMFLFAKGFITDNQSSYAYINGQKYTDMQTVRNQALTSIEFVSSSSDEVEEIVKNLK